MNIARSSSGFRDERQVQLHIICIERWEARCHHHWTRLLTLPWHPGYTWIHVRILSTSVGLDGDRRRQTISGLSRDIWRCLRMLSSFVLFVCLDWLCCYLGSWVHSLSETPPQHDATTILPCRHWWMWQETGFPQTQSLEFRPNSSNLVLTNQTSCEKHFHSLRDL